MLFVALTGNYGMGKSTVLSLFRKFGVSVLDTDNIVESLFKKKNILNKIKQLMGDTVFDDNGSLNKKKVAEIIFKDVPLRLSLEDLLHLQGFGQQPRLHLRDDHVERNVLVAVIAFFLQYAGEQAVGGCHETACLTLWAGSNYVDPVAEAVITINA